MTPVGFEPTLLTLVELESTPLDHSGKLSMARWFGRHEDTVLDVFLQSGVPCLIVHISKPNKINWQCDLAAERAQLAF